ncbi:hypothetical protein ACFOMD_00460 [Sphingoaurantiacus capsulatus]|uniref:Uncharacterized protein n=1 Tax=Sphingoaurantiacus capsulatus TaxID=1771310 RepID=A0ABV7X4J5_9SPHN
MNRWFAQRLDVEEASRRHDVLFAFLATQELDEQGLAALIEEEVDSRLVPDDLIVLVRQAVFEETKKAFATSPTLQTIEGRFCGRCVITLIGYDADGAETNRIRVLAEGDPSALRLEDVKRPLLTAIFRKHGGFVESTPSYHFENPSKRHTERFIRLSNILVRGTEIAFLAFCTLPFIPAEVRVAYIDTPSLYAVVAAINEQRASLAPDRQPLLADNFGSYRGLESYQFSIGPEAIVLISASSSGGMARRFIDAFGFDKDRVVYLLFLGAPGALRIVCDLSKDSRANPQGYQHEPSGEREGDCRMCRAGSAALPLLGDQFDIPGPRPEPLLIQKSYKQPDLTELMGRLAGEHIFSVGLGTPQGIQPRQFYIDPIALLGAKQFGSRLAYVLSRITPAQLSFVIYLDDRSRPLADKVAAVPGGAPKVIAYNELDQLPHGTSTPLMIVAAVVESGRSLQDVSRDLRNIVPKAPLIYLVGLSKSTGEDRRNALSRTLAQVDAPIPHEFYAVEQLVLPSSTEDHAWEAERRLLSDPAFDSLIPEELRPIVMGRIERLGSAAAPLIDDLFVASRAAHPLKLQQGFVFWPDGLADKSSQADVFFTIASVLQFLRASAEKPGVRAALRDNWFQQTLLAPGNFGRFNDGVIQASLLRAARPCELNYAADPAASREMQRIVRRIVEASDKDRGEAAYEFLLALASGRMHLCANDVTKLLADCPTASAEVRLMIEACRRFAIDADDGVKPN